MNNTEQIRCAYCGNLVDFTNQEGLCEDCRISIYSDKLDNFYEIYKDSLIRGETECTKVTLK